MNIEVWKLLLPFAGGLVMAIFAWRKLRIDLKDRKDREAAALRKVRKEALPAPQPLRTNVTLRPDRLVLGREADLERLRTILTWDKTVAVILGQGGLGKSTLAREYANRHQREHRGIWWIGAETEEGRVDGFFGLGVELGLARDMPSERRDVAKAALNRLRADGGGWLVVLDNAPDHAAVRDWLPLGGGAQVIVTTRSGGWPGAFRTVESEILPFASEDDPAVDVLMDAAERTEDRARARALAEALGGLPLALVVAGGWLRDAKGTSFDVYVTRLDDCIKHAPPGDYPDTLIGAVKLSYDRLSEDARAVLDLFAHLAPVGLVASLILDLPRIPFLLLVKKWVPEKIHALSRDGDLLEGAVGELCRRSLLQRAGTEGFVLHRMTARAVRALQGTGRAGWARAAAIVVGPGIHVPISADMLFVRATHGTELALRGDPYAAAMLKWMPVLDWYRALGQDKWGNEVSRAGLSSNNKRLPAESRLIAGGHWVRGQLLYGAGLFSEAEVEIAEHVRFCEMPEGGMDDLATAYGAHGRALDRLSRWPEATRRYQQALTLDLQTLGKLNARVAAGLANLAEARYRQGQRALALALAGRALYVSRSLELWDYETRPVFLANLGAYLLESGAADRAEPLLEESLAIGRAAYGWDDHPNVVTSARWLAQCLLVRAAAGEERAGRESRVRALAAAHGFDTEAERRAAAALPYRPGVEPLEGYVYRPPEDRAAHLPSNFFRKET